MLDPESSENPLLEEDQTGEAHHLPKDVVLRLRAPGLAIRDVDAILTPLVGLDDAGRSRFRAKDLERFRDEALCLPLDEHGDVVIPT